MALGLALLLLMGQTQSASLESARAQLKALRFEPALEIAAAALSAGGASADETAELHFLMAQASAVLGRPDA